MIIEPTIIKYCDQKALVKGFADFFSCLVRQNRGIFNIALSGGNTPRAWFEELAQNRRDSIDWKRIHFFWGDERCVPPDHPDSNYGMAKKLLLNHIDIPNENIHRIQGELPAIQAAEEYATELKRHFGKSKTPQFDLIMLGLGTDGHTASIFPHEADLWFSDDLCVVATHPETGQYRISLTGKVINNAKKAAFLVNGKDKALQVQAILKNSPKSRMLPAWLVNTQNSPVYWYLDKEASANLQA